MFDKDDLTNDQDSIDAKLVEDLLKDVSKEDPAKPEDEAPENLDEAEEVEEEVDVIEEDESDEEDVEPIIPEEKPTRKKNVNTPEENAAFAKMRMEKAQAEAAKAEAEKTAKEEREFLEALARRSGFADVESFKDAARKQLMQKEAEQAGIPLEVYERMKSLEDQVKTINREKEEQMKLAGAQRFTTALDAFVAQYGLGDAGKNQVLERLGEAGYATVDDIIAVKAPEALIKGVMSDIIEKQAVSKHVKAREARPKVDSGTLSTTSTKGKDAIEELIKADVAKFYAD